MQRAVAGGFVWRSDLLCTSCFSRRTIARSAVGSLWRGNLAAVQKLVQQGRLDEALRGLDVLAAQTPEPAGVDKLRGMALYQQNKLSDAEAAFARAAAADPHDIEAAQMDGVTLYRLGRPADAIPLLERSRNEKVASANVDGNYVLGLCYMDTRRYDDARRAFAAQYGFSPDSAEAYLLSARLLFRREYLPVAITVGAESRSAFAEDAAGA